MENERGRRREEIKKKKDIIDGGVHGSKDCACCITCANTASAQSIEELDFDRGLWVAAKDGNLDRVKKLLEKKTPAWKKDISGYSALHYAARSGHYDICKVLLEYGAHANSVTPSLTTPLHRACFMGHEKIVKLLLEHNADPCLTDCDGMNCLHKAAQSGSLIVTELILNRMRYLQKKISLCDNHYRSPYRIAVLSHPNNLQLVTILLTPQDFLREKWISFAMGRHHRLGENSYISYLPEDLVTRIFSLFITSNTFDDFVFS
eukprot:c14316_g1_i1.p1 GENE.c14316_g1_i1~~c14316_g1_i1.p1  ORF type:complete len:262 (+),score=97.15 c14316_g1_i1:27-812(+)